MPHIPRVFKYVMRPTRMNNIPLAAYNPDEDQVCIDMIEPDLMDCAVPLGMEREALIMRVKHHQKEAGVVTEGPYFCDKLDHKHFKVRLIGETKP